MVVSILETFISPSIFGISVLGILISPFIFGAFTIISLI